MVSLPAEHAQPQASVLTRDDRQLEAYVALQPRRYVTDPLHNLSSVPNPRQRMETAIGAGSYSCSWRIWIAAEEPR
ncbi:hypothetical protein GCM10007977_106530 [Dactylosporangium sucinum]|uniref:Uncharacterized protein n=1 Tax=Dactylosporangium sucinum TaxID=1424081 RepID=A0A917UFG1_9ACTN|nr:hypothetical protein GCM10007977_106530 [Dactylosporangium sucinum]